MKLQNVTIVILAKIEGGVKVKHVIENPEMPSSGGKPVFGHYCRRLMTVKEIAAKSGISKGKAADARRSNPIAWLADFDGQAPLLPAAAAA